MRRRDRSISVDTIIERRRLPRADVSIGTDPPTAHLVHTRGGTPCRAYLIQDAAIATSSTSSSRDACLLPLRLICLGRATAEKVAELSGGPTVMIEPPADE